jgi:hypothetical protein
MPFLRPAPWFLAGPLAAMLLAVGGCRGLRQLQVFTVSILNDTGQAVVLRDCTHFCDSSPIVINLAPGSSAPINRTTNEHKYFSITTPSGAHIGCLDLYFQTPQPGARVPVSHATPCPPGGRPPWETIGLIALALAVGLSPILVLAVRRGR